LFGEEYRQPVDLVSIEVRPANAQMTFHLNGKDRWIAHNQEMVIKTSRAVPESRVQRSETVFVGYGIVAPEYDWNDYANVDVKGKTVLILINDPGFATQDPDLFRGNTMTYYGRWTYKYEEAARQGAAGALIVHDTEPAAYGWNVVESSWTGPQAYAQRGENAPPLTAMNGWVQKDAARAILSAAGQDLDALSAAAKQKGFKPVPLGLKAGTSFANDIRSYTSKNVIGLMRGTKRPDEYVIHTAHWDHLGRCTPAADGDDICNGAVDNATGTAALVALAEANAKAGAPARSLVFLAVTAEEQGLLGANFYAENPVFPLAQTVGGLNMDAFQVMGEARDVTVVGGGKSQLDDFLAAGLKAVGKVATPDPTPEAGYYYRSDHFALAKKGVPMFYLRDGQDLINGGKEAGAAANSDYRANRYHGPKDEFDENWDWSGVMSNLQLVYRLSRMLAESTSWPNWNEGDEFRATRDADCSASDVGC
ncbi:MAG TPA: M28 family metallopeptidase, partial [Erythrobacter sp.]|nr:M28 family metallopeptidase [Erythrobacter sp.]